MKIISGLNKYNIEQIDIFTYIAEVERTEAEAKLLNTVSVDPENEASYLKPVMPSLFKRIMSWIIRNYPLLFCVQWVNVYLVTRGYIRSESGGWYYKKYACEQSHLVWIWKAEALKLKLNRRYGPLAWGVISNQSKGQEVDVCIEMRKAAKTSSYELERVLDLPLDKETKLQGQVRNLPHLAPRQVGLPIAINQTVGAALTQVSKGRFNLFKESLRTFGLIKKTCDRCDGTGKTRFTHVQEGICFKCRGEGKLI